MRSLTRMAIRAIALAVTMSCFVPAIKEAQSQSVRPDSAPTRRGRLCWRGRPAPACGVFWVTEFRFEGVVLSTSTRYARSPGFSTTSADLGSRLLWTIGPMSNGSGDRAVGGTLTLGGSETGLYAAVEGRYRRWTDWGGSVDFSAGVARSRPQVPRSLGAAYGPTAAILFVGGDLLEVSVRGDLGFGYGRPIAATSLGVGLGSYAAAGGTVILGALVAWVISSIRFE